MTNPESSMSPSKRTIRRPSRKLPLLLLLLPPRPLRRRSPLRCASTNLDEASERCQSCSKKCARRCTDAWSNTCKSTAMRSKSSSCTPASSTSDAFRRAMTRPSARTSWERWTKASNSSLTSVRRNEAWYTMRRPTKWKLWCALTCRCFLLYFNITKIPPSALPPSRSASRYWRVWATWNSGIFTHAYFGDSLCEYSNELDFLVPACRTVLFRSYFTDTIVFSEYFKNTFRYEKEICCDKKCSRNTESVFLSARNVKHGYFSACRFLCFGQLALCSGGSSVGPHLLVCVYVCVCINHFVLIFFLLLLIIVASLSWIVKHLELVRAINYCLSHCAFRRHCHRRFTFYVRCDAGTAAFDSVLQFITGEEACWSSVTSSESTRRCGSATPCTAFFSISRQRQHMFWDNSFCTASLALGWHEPLFWITSADVRSRSWRVRRRAPGVSSTEGDGSWCNEEDRGREQRRHKQPLHFEGRLQLLLTNGCLCWILVLEESQVQLFDCDNHHASRVPHEFRWMRAHLQRDRLD